MRDLNYNDILLIYINITILEKVTKRVGLVLFLHLVVSIKPIILLINMVKLNLYFKVKAIEVIRLIWFLLPSVH